MKELPEYASQFTNFELYEAVCSIEGKEKRTMLEIRVNAIEEKTMLTMVNEQLYRANSIHQLVHMIPCLEYIEIIHPIYLLWSNEDKLASLIERYEPCQPTNNEQLSLSRIILIVDDKKYKTDTCDTIMDAIWELQEFIKPDAQIWLKTCYHCQFSGNAMDYLVGDRDYWCYRDVPEALDEIRAKRKGASRLARFSGKYFVNAFHTCSAWQLSRPQTSVDQ